MGIPQQRVPHQELQYKTEAIYRRYAIVEEAMLDEAAEKLEAFHAQAQTAAVAGRQAK